MNKDSQIGVVVGTVIAITLLVFLTKQSQEQTIMPIRDTYPADVLPESDLGNAAVRTVNSKAARVGDSEVNKDSTPVVSKNAQESRTEKDPEPVIVKIEKPRKRYYTVVAGDNLYIISNRYYGSGQFVKQIYQANRKRMRSPDHLAPGMKLNIPYPKEILGRN